MSANRFGPKCTPLRYDPTRAFVPFTANSRTELIALHEQLDMARRDLLSDFVLGEKSNTAFLDLPERLLAGYRESRGRSELGRMLAIGKRFRDTVDRVVLVGRGDDFVGARVLFNAGCHPYHNELSRGDRGGRPRIYFADELFDNDATQGLLDLLCHSRPAANVDERWAIIAVEDIDRQPEHSPLLQCLLAALRDSRGEASNAIAELYEPIDGAVGCSAVLSAAGLIPAAVMGLDIVRLLQGAAMMIERFRTAPVGDNPALDHAGLSHVMEILYGANSSCLCPWANALEPVARWHEGLRLEQINSPDDSPRSGGLIINLLVDSVRRDRLMIPCANLGGECSDDRLSEPSAKSLTDIQCAELQATNMLLASQNRPSADIRLPAIDESSLGQLLEMLMLAAVIEGRLHTAGWLPGDIPDGPSKAER